MQIMRKIDFNKRAFKKALADMRNEFKTLIPMSYENVLSTTIQ